MIVADSDERRTEQVADNLTAAGREADPMTVDVATEGEVAAMIDAVLERHGQLDAIVCTSEIESKASIVDCTDEEWDAAVATALKGPFLCIKHGVPALAKGGGGAIVIVSPESAGPIGQVPAVLDVAGGALARMAIRASADYATDHVRVNVVVPDDGSEAWEDVCDAVSFLVSPTPSSLSGSVLKLRSEPRGR